MTRGAFHLREARAIARRALQGGGALVTPTQVAWDVSSTCSSPRAIEVVSKLDPREDWWEDKPIHTAIQVRCRRCAACLRARAAYWRRRAVGEINTSQRTWFGTLTLSDTEQIKYLYRAQLGAKRRGVSWEAPVKRVYGESPDDFARRCNAERFQRVVRAIAPDITKWLKRVRKESGAKLRFLLVAEAHKSGRPHFHILVHEAFGSMPIRKRTLDGQWKLGFSQFRLVAEGDRAASYVTKYLTKTVLARVRASIGYGRAALAVTDLKDQSVSECPPK